MTPIYRSPDSDKTHEMQSILRDHHIETSVIETKKSTGTSESRSVIWYELWLRNLNELARAKTIITQHEFTTYRTNMSSYRTSIEAQKKRSFSIDEAIPSTSLKTSLKPSLYENAADSATRPLIPNPEVSKPGIDNPFLSRPSSDMPSEIKYTTPGAQTQSRESLIPINNKRVFRRLGLLLGFTEEEIQKSNNNNKLYRPWDADELNESVKRLKQKCT